MVNSNETIKRSKLYQSAEHGQINVKLIEVLGSKYGDHYEVKVEFHHLGELTFVRCETLEVGDKELKTLCNIFDNYDLKHCEYTVATSKAAAENPDECVF